jgi:hypothetical protein
MFNLARSPRIPVRSCASAAASYFVAKKKSRVTELLLSKQPLSHYFFRNSPQLLEINRPEREFDYFFAENRADVACSVLK